MKKILMITPYLKSQRGNSQTALRLYSGLIRKGYSIDLLSLEDADWQVHLSRTVKNNNYGLIHCFHALQFARVLAAEPDIKRIPALLTTTGTDINFDLTGPKRNQIRNALWTAAGIVVFNAEFKKKLQVLEPELSSHLIVIPQGVVLSPGPVITRRQLGLSPQDIVFLLPSGLRPVKNIDLALNALDQVYYHYPQLRLLLMGSPIDTEYTRHIKSRLLKLKWAIYPGEVNHKDIQGFLQAGDIVLNTSLAEGQPQGALEAMSLGKPCLLTAVAGNLGIIEHGRQGFYFHNEADFYNYACHLIINPELRKKLGASARQLVLEKFDVKTELCAYDRLYQKYLTN